MKMMRWMCIVLCMAMLLTMLPASALLIEGVEELPEESTETQEQEGPYALHILNRPGTSFELDHGHLLGVYDLWKEVDSEDAGELRFDQTFSIDINDAIDVYNSYLDTKYNGERENYKASEDIHNDATFYVEARIWINDDNDLQFRNKASYTVAPYDMEGNLNEDCGAWSISSYYSDLSEEFFSMSKDNNILTFSIDGTVKDIYEALKEKNGALGETTINSLLFDVWVSCEVEYRNSWGSTSYTEQHFESLSYTLYDKHIYESAEEYGTLPVVPVTAPITVNVTPAYEGCYEPVKAEYNWYYEFIKEGEEEEDGEYKWYGYFEKDESKESDVLTEIAPSGTVYGVAYGTVDSGENNSILLSDILNEDNKAFINSFIGEKPRELGGKGQMFIGCTVTLTFEDGKQWVVSVTKADYMSRLILPCMHACTVCGYCTVTDKMLPCNFDPMYYEICNVCICDEPSAPTYTATVEAEEQMTIASTERTVTVVVEKIEVEEAPANAFILNATDALGLENVLAFYNIDVFDEEGVPYILNQWGDMGEALTVTVPISPEAAEALQSGEAKLYHIATDGTPEEVEGVTVAIDGESATMTFTASSFSPFLIAYEDTTPCTHTKLIPLSAKEPTCTEAGCKAYYKCGDCGKYFADADAAVEIPDLDAWKEADGKLAALGHQYTEELRDADHLRSEGTCKEYKTYWYDCAACDANAKDDAAAADKFYTSDETGRHSYGSRYYGYAATFLQEGVLEHFQCSECGKYFDVNNQELESIVIPKLSTDLSICVNGTPVALVLTEQNENNLVWALEGLSVEAGDRITICQTDDPSIVYSYSADGENNNVDTDGIILSTAAAAQVELLWTPNGFYLTISGYRHPGIVVQINGVQYPMHFVTYNDGETTSYIYGYVELAVGDRLVVIDNTQGITYDFDDLADTSSWNEWDYHRGDNGEIVIDYAARYGLEFDWMGQKELDITKVFAPMDGSAYQVEFGDGSQPVEMDQYHFPVGSENYQEAVWYIAHEKTMNNQDILACLEENGYYFYNVSLELEAGTLLNLRNLTNNTVIGGDHLVEMYTQQTALTREGDSIKVLTDGSYQIVYVPCCNIFAIEGGATASTDVYMYLDGDFIPMTTDADGYATYEGLQATTSTNILFADGNYSYLPITLSADTNSSYAYVYVYGDMSMLFFNKAGTYNLRYHVQTGELTIVSANPEPENPVVNYTYYLIAVDNVNGNTSGIMPVSSENAKEYCQKNFAISQGSYIRIAAYGDDGSTVYHAALSDTPASVATTFSTLIQVNMGGNFDIYFNTESQTVRIVPLTAHEHVWSDWIIYETAHSHTCLECGETETGAHALDNGVCTDCGYAKPAIVITGQPADQTVAQGASAQFAVEAEGEGLQYRWQYSMNGGKSWTSSSSATEGYNTATLTVVGTLARNGFMYRCKLTDEKGNAAYSEAVMLTVEKPYFAFTAHPQAETVKLGNRAAFTVAAEGEGLSYQWQYQMVKDGPWWNCTQYTKGYNTTELNVIAEEKREGFLYRCRITDSAGNKYYSEAAALSVDVPVSTAVLTQPMDAYVMPGKTTTFHVEVQGQGLTYQWEYHKGVGKSGPEYYWITMGTTTGCKTDTLTIAGISGTTNRDGWAYRCVVKDANGYIITTEYAFLHVTAAQITAQPESVTAAVGSKAVFAVETEGEVVSYQWQYSKNGGNAWYNSSAATQGYNTDTLTVDATAARNGFMYRCVIMDAEGNRIETYPVTLTVK